MKIDSHQHFWQYDPVRDSWIDESMTKLRRDFLPEHLHDEIRKNGFTGTVAVQAAENDDETRWLLALAAQHSWIKKVVGWIDLTSDRLEDDLGEYGNNKQLAGFRQILQSSPPAYLADKKFRRGIATLTRLDYTYDLLIYPDHLPAALELVHEYPEQKFVIDHLAKPPIRLGEIEDWRADFRQIAHCENVFCKLSGLVTEADWSSWHVSQLVPYVDVALEAFGADRLMFGSDWPVATLAAGFDQVVDTVHTSLQKLSSSEQQMIMGGTACRFYGILDT